VRPRLSWLGLGLVIGVTGACDLKPTPRKQPEPAAASAQVPAPASAAADPDNAAQACMQIGARVADLTVTSAPDAVARAQFEQARADTVRAIAEACLRGKWDAGLRRCFLAASTQPEVDACKARAPAGARPTPGS
jgi:hypothetical protein